MTLSNSHHCETAPLFTRVPAILSCNLSRFETRAKYCGKTHGGPVGTNHCKFLSSHPRVSDDGRDRALDGGRQEGQPLGPSGRDYDPDRLSPRLAGVRVVRSAMVAG